MSKRRRGDFAPFTVVERLCVTGGKLRAPYAVEVTIVDKEPCVLVASTVRWINQALWGVTRSADCRIVMEFTDTVLKKLNPDAEEPSATAGAGSVASAKSKLGIDSDESSASADEGAATNHRRQLMRNSKSPKKRNNDWTTVCIDGAELTARCSKMGKALLIHPTSESLTTVMQILQSRAQISVSEKKARRYKSEEGLAKKLDPHDVTKITWLFSKTAWQIQWRDGDDNLHKSYQDFVVPRSHVDGQLLRKEEFEKLRATIKEKAKLAWNQKDCSRRHRYALDSSQIVDSCSG